MASPKKSKFTPEQEKQLEELYLRGEHKNPEIGKIMGFSRGKLNHAIALLDLPEKFKQKHGMCKTQYITAQVNKSTDNPECPHTGKEAIRHWYIEKGLTAPVIANKLGLTQSQVKYKIGLYNLKNIKTRTYTPKPKEKIKDLTTIITDIEKPRVYRRDSTFTKKKYQPNDKTNFNDAKKEREKNRHLRESDLSTLDISQLTPTTCRGINTKDGKDTFCLAQIDPAHTYCQHHRSIYYTRQQA